MRQLAIGALGLALVAAMTGAEAGAQTPASPIDSTVGVLLVAHGATAQWNAPVESLAVAVRRHGVVHGPVAVAFLMGDSASSHRFQDAVASLQAQGARRVVTVPLLVSSYSGHYRQLQYLTGVSDTLGAEMKEMLHHAGIGRATGGPPITLTPALDDAPELARVIAERANALVAQRSGRALFLLGHGPNSAEDDAEWMRNLRAVADSVRAETGYAFVSVGVVRDDAPPLVRAEAVLQAREIIALQYAATHQPVAVVPVLISSGAINRRKFPADLADLPIVYDGEPLLPDAQFVAWVERRVRTAAGF